MSRMYLLGDDDLAVQQVDSLAREADQLAPPQAGERGRVDQRAPPVQVGVGQLGHLVGGEEAHLRGGMRGGFTAAQGFLASRCDSTATWRTRRSGR